MADPQQGTRRRAARRLQIPRLLHAGTPLLLDDGHAASQRLHALPPGAVSRIHIRPPAAPDLPCQTSSVVSALAHDASPRVRLAAAASIATLLQGVAQAAYLGLAEVAPGGRTARCVDGWRGGQRPYLSPAWARAAGVNTWCANIAAGPNHSEQLLIPRSPSYPPPPPPQLHPTV